MENKKKEEEDLEKVQEQYADRGTLERLWKEKLSPIEGKKQDRMIDPSRKAEPAVVTK